jgi:hypothetical protein
MGLRVALACLMRRTAESCHYRTAIVVWGRVPLLGIVLGEKVGNPDDVVD